MRMYVWFPDAAVGVAVAEVEPVEELKDATQDEGFTGAGTTQEQALEIADGIEEHCDTKVGRPVVAVLVAVV